MINRKSIRDYDRFRRHASEFLHPEFRLPVVTKGLNLWKKATVLVPLAGLPSFVEDYDVVIAGEDPVESYSLQCRRITVTEFS